MLQNMFLTNEFLNLIACHHLHTTINHIHSMELGLSDTLAHGDRVGIAAYLRLCLLHGGCHLLIGGLALEIFQLDDIGVLHVRVNLMKWTEKDISIAALIVKLGDRTIVAALARKGKSVAMHESLTFLTVALRGKGVDAVGYILEERLEGAIVCHVLLQLSKLISV